MSLALTLRCAWLEFPSVGSHPSWWNHGALPTEGVGCFAGHGVQRRSRLYGSRAWARDPRERHVMTIRSSSGLTSCCNSVSCFSGLHCAGTNQRACYRDRLGKQGAFSLHTGNFLADLSATFFFFEPLERTGGLSIPLRQQVPGIWTIVFSHFLDSVQ